MWAPLPHIPHTCTHTGRVSSGGPPTHTAGKSVECQLRGKQPCCPAWQSWGTSCSPRPSSTATHILVGDRQAQRLEVSWQERQSQTCNCFVSGSQSTSQEKDPREGQSGGSQTSRVHMAYPQGPSRAWEGAQFLGVLKQVPEGHSGRHAAPFGRGLSCPGAAELQKSPSRKCPLLGRMSPLSAGQRTLEGHRACGQQTIDFLQFSRRMLESKQDCPCQGCVLCFGDSRPAETPWGSGKAGLTTEPTLLPPRV